MSTFKVLKIEVADFGAAMDESKALESARMLRRLADRIEETNSWPDSMWGLFDTNGNAVGHADTINRRDT
jgi:hypothetical protein